MTGTVPCGGCGETVAVKRCIGCLHDFTPEAERDPYKWIKAVTMARGGHAYWYVKCRSGSYHIVSVRYDVLRDDGSFMAWMFDREGGIELEELDADDFFRAVDKPTYIPQ